MDKNSFFLSPSLRLSSLHFVSFSSSSCCTLGHECVCAVCAVSVCLCRLYACTPSVPYKTHSFIFFFASSLPSSSWFCYLYGGKTMLSKSVWHTVCVCVYAVLACVIWVLWCTRLLCIHTDPYRNDRYRKPRESTARYRQMNSSKSIRHDDERR